MLFRSNDTAYEMCVGDWSSDVCSSDLPMQEMWVQSLGWKGPLEEEMAPYSSGKGAEIMAG